MKKFLIGMGLFFLLLAGLGFFGMLGPTASESMLHNLWWLDDEQNLVHFAGYAKYIGFYPTPGVLEAFSDELTKFVRSKGAVQFPLDTPIPYGLIKRMVQYRIKNIQ